MTIPTLNPIRQTKTRWQEIVDIWQKDKWLYGIIGLIAGSIFGIAAADYLGQIVTWFAGGFWNEALSIAITVIVLDRLSKLRNEQERKEELIFQLGSEESVVTKQASSILEHKGWLKDGSLQGVNLKEANLESIRLQNANLEGVMLFNAKLQDGNLEKVNLESAFLVHSNLKDVYAIETNLQEANLWMANLHNAVMIGVNLRGANLTEANLTAASLSGDLRDALLIRANLQGANLYDTNLEGAILEGANLAEVIWERIIPVSDVEDISIVATLPDGSDWTPDRDMREFTHPEEWAAEQATKSGE